MSRKHITLLLLLVNVASCCLAQSQLLSFAPGAKSVGLGKSGVVEVYDPTAIYWNPASLGALNYSQSIFSIHQPNTINYAGYSHFFPLRGSFAINVGKTTGGDNPVELTGLGYGFHLGNSFYTGFSLNVLQIDKTNWTTGGIGFLYKPLAKKNDDKSIDNTISSFFNQLTLGISIQHIPLIVSDYDHQIRMGGSYNLAILNTKIIYSHHFQRDKDTDHLGLTFSPFSQFEIMAGLNDVTWDKLGIGAVFYWENIGFGISYDQEIERVAVSTTFRIGQSPVVLAEREYKKAKNFLMQQNKRNALVKSRKALAYNPYQLEAARLVSNLEPILKRENQQIDSLLILAKTHEKKNWYISAAANYLKVLRLDPQNKNAEVGIRTIRPKVNIHTERLYLSGVKYFELGDFKNAEYIFESILLVRPDHIASKIYLDKVNNVFQKNAEEFYYTGLGFYRQRNLEQAQEHFQKALDLIPNYADALYYLDKIDQDKKNNKIRLNELYQQANTLEKSGSISSALTKYEQILKLDPSHQVAREKMNKLRAQLASIINRHYAHGKSAYNSGKYLAAQNSFKSILAIQPSHEGARRYLSLINKSNSGKINKSYENAQSHYASENWEAALSALDSALAINPYFKEAKQLQEKTISMMGVEKLLEKAKSEYLSGQYLQALEKFNQVLENDPTNMDALELREQSQLRLNEQVEEHFTRGIQLYTEEKYQSAINEWNKVLQINPNHSGALEYKKKAQDRIEALNQLP